tara:strand:- start:2555 stop:2818 length:264 start_codon:yes stop_codon:yes gene_type:complete
MDFQKIALAGAGVCAVGSACVVGGNAVIDKVTDGPSKRRDATVEAIVSELKPFIKEQIRLSFPLSTGDVIRLQKPINDYREQVNGSN